jgi:hypothetical protein
MMSLPYLTTKALWKVPDSLSAAAIAATPTVPRR